MNIKIFDLVEVNGIRSRVMTSPDEHGTVRVPGTVVVSGLGDVGLSAIKLVESVTIQTFEVGDKVTITQIPIVEQHSYTYGWNHTMSKMMKRSALNGAIYTVTKVELSREDNGFRYKLDDTFWFAPYHLKNVADYQLPPTEVGGLSLI